MDRHPSTSKMNDTLLNSTDTDTVVHPWPYLASVFEFLSTSAKTHRFKCLLCLPKVTECSAYHNSPSNLKKHVERMHPGHVQDYEKLTESSRKRKAENARDGGSAKKFKQQPITSLVTNANMVSQAAVDEAIVNLVVGALLPLRIVEIREFIELITTLQPNRHVLARSTLRCRITDEAKRMKERLVDTLKQQPYVATTTDAWSCYGKSYIGVTVHWIHKETLERKSAYLALRRLKGSHTYDVIAGALDDIHAEYGITRKIVRTTTDNGANFVKAFSMFSAPSQDDTYADADDASDDDGDATTEPVDVYSTLSETDSQSEGEYSLPRHQRCGCHTLNLVATVDADKAESDLHYKKVSRSTFGKCQGLWNKYGRSAMAVETVNDAYGLGLKRPNATRWNSVYLATERLVRLISEHGEDEFRTVCSKLEVPRFTDADLAFLTEYVAVMKPVAQALNILQSESKMFMAYLLPTITILKEKLQNRRESAGVCAPLIDAMLCAIDRRFAEAFADKDAIAAAILHPKFRTSWTDNQAVIDTGMRHIRHLLETSTDRSAASAHG